MFEGGFSHNADTKGRIILPSSFREELGDSLVITKGLDRCLYVFHVDIWNEYREKISKLPFSDPGTRTFIRHFISFSSRLDFDANGRVLVPNTLREYAGIKRDILSMGAINHIEIWSKEYFDEDNSLSAAIAPEIAEKMAALGI